jgi:hypothetical protein
MLNRNPKESIPTRNRLGGATEVTIEKSAGERNWERLMNQQIAGEIADYRGTGLLKISPHAMLTGRIESVDGSNRGAAGPGGARRGSLKGRDRGRRDLVGLVVA